MIERQTVDVYTEYGHEPEIELDVEPDYPDAINQIIDKPFTLVTAQEWQIIQDFFKTPE